MGPRPAHLFPDLAAWVEERAAEFGSIPGGRRATLDALARFVDGRLATATTARLTFICTHNSRRSQMCQVWAHTAARWYRVPRVASYSGGTEAAALDPRAVAALRRAGFHIEAVTAGDNPIWRIRFSADAEPLECFSKRYDQPPNPAGDFCAIMTCSEADRGCPLVLGASERISLPYDDPKVCDGTSRESAAYDERCRQIAREMLYALSVAALGETPGEHMLPTPERPPGANSRS